MENVNNIYANLPAVLENEDEAVILEQNNSRLVRILSRGHTSQIYDQAEDEWVLVLEGEAELSFPQENNRILKLKKGDYLYLAAGRQHQVVKTSDPCLWLCLFLPAAKL